MCSLSFTRAITRPDSPNSSGCSASRGRFRQRPRVQPPADGRQNILAPVELVGRRRSTQVAAGIHVPQQLAGRRIERRQPSRLVSSANTSSSSPSKNAPSIVGSTSSLGIGCPRASTPATQFWGPYGTVSRLSPVARCRHPSRPAGSPRRKSSSAAVAARGRRPRAEPARRPEPIVTAVVRFARDLDAGDPAPGAEPQEVRVRAALLGPE
jgi:hypothetical protein